MAMICYVILFHQNSHFFISGVPELFHVREESLRGLTDGWTNPEDAQTMGVGKFKRVQRGDYARCHFSCIFPKGGGTL
jgi:hypothetical protein